MGSTIFQKALPAKIVLNQWSNIGGQLMPAKEVDDLITKIKAGKINSWDATHNFYKKQEALYPIQKLHHAIAAYQEVYGINIKKARADVYSTILDNAIKTRDWMTKEIYNSREKDYSNPFRQMVYDSQQEMDAVVGKLEDNSFIKDQKEEMKVFKKKANSLKKQFMQLNEA